MASGDVIDQLRSAADALGGHSCPADRLRAIQRAQDALDAAKAAAVVELEESRGFEDEGSSTPKAWLARELRLDPAEAGTLSRVGAALHDLPLVAEAFAAGRLRLAHVRELAFALKHVGREVVVEAQPWLLEVATACEPAELRRVVKALREAVYPDELDEAWVRGMERQDVRLSPVPEGWHLTGFLGAETGAKLDVVLRSLSAPRDADDDRSTAERRVDGFDELLTGVIEHGLPQDRGVRPHLTATADHDTLAHAAGASREPGTHPAHLHGFGSIGKGLLGLLLCGSDATPVLTDAKHAVLDVGPTVRLATAAQRKAVNARQGGECAAPHCSAPVVHVHHVVWHSKGGPTDLANLVGLCPRCHTLVHRGLLHVDPVDHRFTVGSGAPVLARPSRYLQARRARERVRRRRPEPWVSG